MEWLEGAAVTPHRSTRDTRSAPKPRAWSSRVAATSDGISCVHPYFTLIFSPLGSSQSNFGVVPLTSSGLYRQLVKSGSITP